MRFTAALLTATAVMLAGCDHKTETTTTSTDATTVNATDAAPDAADNSAAPVAPAGQTFANGAAASDAFEIASSKLAADNGSSAAVRKFASQMVDAHTQSTAKLTSIAGGLTPPITPDGTLTSDQQSKLDELKTKKGSDFDQVYVADQVAAHEQALAMLQSYAGSGDVPQFKDFAAGLAPKVAAHLNMAKALKP
jgi:putative membrane protein